MNRFSKNQRGALLIDAETLEIFASEKFNAKVNYEKLIQEVSPYELIRAIYFKPQDQLNSKWVQMLSNWGYETQGSLGNSDTWLVVTAISLAEKCDVIILAGGDKHYLPLLAYLRAKGVKSVVRCWQGATSAELKKSADEFRPLTMEFLISKPNNLSTLIAA